MQSGITASAELTAAFNDLVATPSQRGLLVTIDKEKLLPGSAIESSSSDFFSDLDNLAPHIKDNEAAYIILRRYPDASDSFIAVTYVPDAAYVRQKMLFASTRLTLIRELGIERFRETIFATTKAELTADGFRKHDEHVELEAPLTEEEQTLGAVKRAESEEGRGSSVKRSHISDHFAMPISDDAMGSLKKLGESGGGDNLVQLKINISSETIELASTSTATLPELSTTISSSEPRFSFFKHSHDDSTSIIFIYTCPGASKIKERMLYASSRQGVVSVAEKGAGLKIAKKIEASDPDELSPESIEEEFKPKVEVKKAFDRPKRPGRR
ncbi:hypothetical protein V497_01755 [Pseudogymnoascus sp. VKM F-4516 (FW-969)]|nr:hypothetical protein V490_02057 [Pseudogymnoascus sp. VKM F-3557]KFY64340.1 hypothetical protein V497_01755 [Pseudogymnoascus sp. VKM F-4516 (FW-969)]